MKYLLGLILLISVSASAQYSPTAAKTRFVNGIGLGTKDTATMNAADTVAMIVGRDSLVYFRYKGYWKPLAYNSSLGSYVKYTDTASMLSGYLPLYLRTAPTTVNINNKYFNIYGQNAAGAYTSGRLDITGELSSVGYQKNGSSYGLQIDTTGTAYFISHTQNPINYLSDYSANFTTNSLITKGYISAGYVPYTGATSAIDLNSKTVVNISKLGINTTTVPTILLRAIGDNNSTSRISLRGYSSDANSSSMRVTKFRGTVVAPQAPQSGDNLGKFELAGYGTTSSDGYPQASFEGIATENWGAIARGAKIQFKVTPNTTTIQALALTINQDKSALFENSITGTSLIKTGGTSSQFLKADGSVTTIIPSGSIDTGRAVTAIATGGSLNKVRDSLQANIGLKLNISDTATMLSGYKTYYPRAALSAGTGITYNSTTGVITNSSPSTGGTVTSIATDATMTGGTITTSGTLKVDTSIMATRLRVQKGIDSLGAAKQGNITLTTTGTSGAATFSANTLNIPQYQSVLTNPITGTGTSGQVAYFNGTSSITSNAAFAFTPTSQLLVNNSVTAASLIARGTNLTPTLTAAANSDVLVGLDINPTFTNGAFTGVTNWGVRLYNSIRFETSSDLGQGIYWKPANDGTILKIYGSNYSAGVGFLQLNVQSGSDGLTVNGASRNLTINAALTSISMSLNNIIFNTHGTNEAARIVVSSKNFLIGTNTDAGYKLDVNGTGRFSGALTGTSATFSQKVQVTGSTSPSNGSGLELFYDGSYAGILGYNRTSSAYLPVAIDGSTVTLFTSSTPRLTIASTGAATFSSTLGINGTADNVKSGTYTPTITLVTNAASSTARICQYMRVGSVVTVSGYVTVTATTPGAGSRIYMSLPISSSFTSTAQAGGAGGVPGGANIGTVIFANSTATTVSMDFLPTSGATDYWFTYTYQIL